MLNTVWGPERQLSPNPESSRHGDAHRRTSRRPPAAGTTTGASVAAGLTVLVCLVVRLPDLLLRATGLRGWAPALVGVLVLVNGARVMAQAPFTFVRRDASPSRWAAEQVKALGGMIVVGTALTVPLYALLRATRWWWLWAWALFALVTVLTQAAMPYVLRVQTGPLSPAPSWLAGRVGTVARLAGVDVGHGVLVADQLARPGPHINAYVVGCGPSRRVVLESGVAAWPPELIDQVVAHEIGHWRMGHVAARLPIAVGAQLATFALAGALLSTRALLDVAAISSLGDPRSYPLLLALTTLLVLPARLLLAAYDRGQERAADRFALTLLGAPSDFAAMLDRAADEGQAPRELPWRRYLTASHPPIGERLLACQRFASLSLHPVGLDTRRLDTAGLDTAALDTVRLTAGLDSPGLDTAALDTAALDTAALDSPGLDRDGLDREGKVSP